MATKPIKRPRDPIELAKLIGDIATGLVDDVPVLEQKDPVAVARGKLGGEKGGAARAKALTSEQRTAIAKRAAAKRWKDATAK